MPSRLTASPGSGTVNDNALCRCGCGRVAVAGLEAEATLLRLGTETAKELQRKTLSGGRRREQAESLLWAWERAEPPLRAGVHDDTPPFLGTPTKSWVMLWRQRAKQV